MDLSYRMVALYANHLDAAHFLNVHPKAALAGPFSVHLAARTHDSKSITDLRSGRVQIYELALGIVPAILLVVSADDPRTSIDRRARHITRTINIVALSNSHRPSSNVAAYRAARLLCGG